MSLVHIWIPTVWKVRHTLTAQDVILTWMSGNFLVINIENIPANSAQRYISWRGGVHHLQATHVVRSGLKCSGWGIEPRTPEVMDDKTIPPTPQPITDTYKQPFDFTWFARFIYFFVQHIPTLRVLPWGMSQGSLHLHLCQVRRQCLGVGLGMGGGQEGCSSNLGSTFALSLPGVYFIWLVSMYN